MSGFSKESPRRQVMRLLLVLGGSLLGAFALATFFVMHYGPSGQYQLDNALLKPDLLLALNYNDNDKVTGGQSRFAFNDLTYRWYDGKDKTWRQSVISQEVYQKFYSSVAKDVSMLKIPEAIEQSFVTENPSVLALTVRTESNAAWQSEVKLFQQVQFLKGWYRVSLNEQNSQGQWIYFEHPGIYESTHRIFIGS